MNTEWKNPLEELDLLTQEEFDALPDEIVNGIYKDQSGIYFKVINGGEYGLTWERVWECQSDCPDALWQSKCNSLATYLTEWRKQRAMFKKPVEQWDKPIDPHRYNKLLYAEDCKYSDTPWQWWEFANKTSDIWTSNEHSIPAWVSFHKYRRKPDAPKLFIDFQMDLTNYTDDQRLKMQEWLRERGYKRFANLSNRIGYQWIHARRDGVFLLNYQKRTKGLVLTPEECGIQH